jgi:hypothetical protein
MSSRDPFVTVRRSVVDDPRFATIYRDNAAFGAFVKLMISADAAWPTSAEVPAWCAADVLERLRTAGLVAVEGDRYRVPDIDSDRLWRSERAKAAGKASGESGKWKDNPAFVAHIGGSGTTVPAEQPVPMGTSQPNPPQPTATYPTSGQVLEDDDWDPAWWPFLKAWHGRGFRHRPSQKQREKLWPIVDARPSDAASWVTAAPRTGGAPDVVAYVWARWERYRSEVAA